MNDELIGFDIGELDDILLSCGVLIDTEMENAEIPMDSIMFISMIVELENRYELQIPDEMLSYTYWNTREAIAANIKLLLATGNEN